MDCWINEITKKHETNDNCAKKINQSVLLTTRKIISNNISGDICDSINSINENSTVDVSTVISGKSPLTIYNSTSPCENVVKGKRVVRMNSSNMSNAARVSTFLKSSSSVPVSASMVEETELHDANLTYIFPGQAVLFSPEKELNDLSVFPKVTLNDFIRVPNFVSPASPIVPPVAINKVSNGDTSSSLCSINNITPPESQFPSCSSSIHSDSIFFCSFGCVSEECCHHQALFFLTLMNLTGKAVELLVTMAVSSSSVPNSVLLGHADYLASHSHQMDRSNDGSKIFKKVSKKESKFGNATNSKIGDIEDNKDNNKNNDCVFGVDDCSANLKDLITYIKQCESDTSSNKYGDGGAEVCKNESGVSIGAKFALGCSTMAVKDGRVMVCYFIKL
jgi:hypothetical protein